MPRTTITDLLGWTVGGRERGYRPGPPRSRPRSRRQAAGVGTHRFVLLAIGPLGLPRNPVVWPWNLALILLVVALFARPETDRGVASRRCAAPRIPRPGGERLASVTWIRSATPSGRDRARRGDAGRRLRRRLGRVSVVEPLLETPPRRRFTWTPPSRCGCPARCGAPGRPHPGASSCHWSSGASRGWACPSIRRSASSRPSAERSARASPTARRSGWSSSARAASRPRNPRSSGAAIYPAGRSARPARRQGGLPVPGPAVVGVIAPSP